MFHPTRAFVTAAAALAVAATGIVPAAWQPRAARAADPLAAPGVAMIPQDAAFVSSTLRLREQWQRFANSNAYAALRRLPAVARALDTVEEQKLQPGSPLSMLATFLELPENTQALELLDDMISSDTFVYGEPSCITVLQLVKKIQQAQNAAGVLRLASGGSSLGGMAIEVEEMEEMEEDDDDEDDDDEDDDDEDDDGPRARRKKKAAAARSGVIRPVRLQATDVDEPLSADDVTTRLVIKTLADNTDLIVVPDIVWGFKTTKADAGKSQLKRIEVLAKLFTQANPALADSLERRKVAGGDIITFTIKPEADLIRTAAEVEDQQEEVEKIIARVEKLRLVIGLGLIGDRVILSIGDSIDHLEKLALPGGDAKGLLATKPFAPLLAHKDKRITAISYLSQPLQAVLAASADDLEQLAEMSDTVADLADLPDGAAEEARRMLQSIAAGYKRRLPVPGPWMSFSFLAEQGYEGYAWDWSKNLPFDGGKRLDLLEHVGGAPLAALAFRVKNDPDQFEDFASWADMGWSFFRKYLLPKADENDQETFAEVDEHLAPVARKMVGIVRTKILPALAEGQLAFVIDGKTTTKQPHQALPAASEPLPLLEPAIVLGLTDPKLFREGLSDLFELSDELVDAVREVNPDAVPAEYRVPEPAKTKVEGGTLWSFALPGSGFDEKVQPSIGVGDDAAVLSLVPRQVGRLLTDIRLETGSGLTKFEEPLAAAAALDFAGLIDSLQPWLVYLTRYGCVAQRDGVVDPGEELGPDDENPQAKDALEQGKVVLEALKSLRVAVAEMAVQDDATVTHWRNVIRDMPAK